MFQRLKDFGRRRRSGSDSGSDSTGGDQKRQRVREALTDRGVVVATSSNASSVVVPVLPSAGDGETEEEDDGGEQGVGANSAITLSMSKGKNLGLTLLSEPKNSQSAIVDIVFVHGLTGNAYTTWLYRSGKRTVYWLQELLSQSFPDARILAFGYDADITQFWGPASSNRVGNHAENLLGSLSRLRARTETEDRKIIFVAHSLGGLVIECALSLSKASPEDDIPLIEQNTIGIAFLGTPHHGSDYAAWITLASSLTKWIKRSNKNIVAVLEPDSEVLAIIQKGFQGLLTKRRDVGKKIAVVCFYEELPVTGIGPIVPMHSALLSAYPSYGIHANHMDMTKFGSAKDKGFEDVEGELLKWVKELRNLREDFVESLVFSGISNRHESIDVAHSETLHWIWTRPSIEFRSWLASEGSIFWIAGKAGSGKSTIMKRLLDDAQLFRELKAIEKFPGKCREVIIAACFLDYKGTTLARSAEGLLRTLLRRIVMTCPTLFLHVDADFRKMKDSEVGISWTLRSLRDFLVKIILSSPQNRFFFLVDALDEYQGDDASIADILVSISGACTSNLQFCLSSRPHIDFREKFEACRQLHMEYETREDIEKYTNSIFQDHIERHGVTYQILVDDIVSHAQGLFIWVKLASNEILRAAKRGEDLYELQKRLKGMPEDLNEFYQRILDQLDQHDRDEARAMLSIIMHATEAFLPLNLRYAVHFATGIYTEFSESLAETRIMAVCGGLLEFGNPESRHVGAEELMADSRIFDTRSRRGIRLAHRSVHHFLEKHSPETIQGIGQDGMVVTGSVLLLRACMNALIELLDRTIRVEDNGRHTRRCIESSLAWIYTFALKSWVKYAQQAEWDTNQPQAVLETFDSGGYFHKWYRIASTIAPLDTRGNMRKKQRTVLARTIHTKRVLLEDDMCLEIGNPSVWPWSNINCNVPPSTDPGAINATLNRSADRKVTWQTTLDLILSVRRTGTPYKEALPSSFLEFIISVGLEVFPCKLLASHFEKSFISLTSDQLPRLLFAVARGGSIEVANLLFKHSSHINLEQRSITIYLSRAIFFRHFGLARLFIAKGIDFHISGIYYRDLKGQPMDVAVKYNNRTAVKLLLESGIDINARISYWGTALQCAAKDWNTSMVKFLLDHGADANVAVPRSIYGSALEAALLSPSRIYDWRLPSTIAILLEHEANPSVSRSICNVLVAWAAALIGEWRGLKQLLEYGARIDTLDAEGHTLLFRCLRSRYIARQTPQYHVTTYEYSPTRVSSKDHFQVLTDHGASLTEEEVTELIRKTSSFSSFGLTAKQFDVGLSLLSRLARDELVGGTSTLRLELLLKMLVRVSYVRSFSTSFREKIQRWADRRDGRQEGRPFSRWR